MNRMYVAMTGRSAQAPPQVAVLILIAQISCGGPPSPAAPSPAPAAPEAIYLQSPTHDQAAELVEALAALSYSEPLLHDLQKVAIQRAARPGDMLSIVVINDHGDRTMPEICGRLPSRDLPLCNAKNQCMPSRADLVPTIACNARFLSDIEILVKLWTGSSAVTDAIIHGDSQVMRLLERVRREPEQLLREASISATTQDAFVRMVALCIVLIAHELHHVAHPTEPHPASVSRQTFQGLSQSQGDELRRARVACRNMGAFKRIGPPALRVQGSHVEFPTDSGLPISIPIPADEIASSGTDPSTSELVKRSLDIWTSELAADEHALQAITSLINAKPRPFAERVQMVSEALDGVMLMTALTWFSRESTFIDTLCPSAANQARAISSCVCADPRNRWRLSGLLNELHPPMPLRLQHMEETLSNQIVAPEPRDRLALVSHDILTDLEFVYRFANGTSNMAWTLIVQQCGLGNPTDPKPPILRYFDISDSFADSMLRGALEFECSGAKTSP